MEHGVRFSLPDSPGNEVLNLAVLAPETRFDAGDVAVILGEPDALVAAEFRLLQG